MLLHSHFSFLPAANQNALPAALRGFLILSRRSMLIAGGPHLSCLTAESVTDKACRVSQVTDMTLLWLPSTEQLVCKQHQGLG